MNTEELLLNLINETEGVFVKEANFGVGHQNSLKIEFEDPEDAPKWDYFSNVARRAVQKIKISRQGRVIEYVFPNHNDELQTAIATFYDIFTKKYFLIPEPPQEGITIIAKITNLCNLDCVYCYDRPFREKLGHNKTLPLEKLDKILDMATRYAKSTELLFHGGEPTVAGLNYYKRFVSEVLPKYPYGNIAISMQTNGTLLNDDWFEFIKEFNENHQEPWGIGSSYNCTEEELRHSQEDNPLLVGKGGIDKVLGNIYRAKEFGINIGVIDVLTKKNHKNVIKIYEKYKDLQVRSCFNTIYRSGAANDPDLLFETEEDFKEYRKTTTEYFTCWIGDKDERCYIDRYASEYIGLLCNTFAPCCEYAYDCTGRWVAINSNGDMYSCDRALPSKYRFGNISDFTSLEDVYQHSKGFLTLKKERLEKLNNICGAKCKYYSFCKGGCPMKDIDIHCNASKPNTNACQMTQAGFKSAYQALCNSSIETCNKFVKGLFLKGAIVFPKEIPALIKYLHAEDLYPKNLDYDKNTELFTDEFYVWLQMINIYRKVNPKDEVEFGIIYPDDAEDDRFEKIKTALMILAGNDEKIITEKEEKAAKGEKNE